MRGWAPLNAPVSSLDTYKQFDADAADADTVRKTLAVLIEDLKKQGILSK